jgi:hypothetical protein
MSKNSSFEEYIRILDKPFHYLGLPQLILEGNTFSWRRINLFAVLILILEFYFLEYLLAGDMNQLSH